MFAGWFNYYPALFSESLTAKFSLNGIFGQPGNFKPTLFFVSRPCGGYACSGGWQWLMLIRTFLSRTLYRF
ncbi:hypothetical protein DXV38_17125 [Escherichia albertii]|nr:hypothetical protein [Escherichia albertii]